MLFAVTWYMASAYSLYGPDYVFSHASPSMLPTKNNALHKRDCQQRTSGSIAAARGRKKVGERVCRFLLSEAASPCGGWSCAETLSSLAFAPDMVDWDGGQNSSNKGKQNAKGRERRRRRRRRRAGDPLYIFRVPAGRKVSCVFGFLSLVGVCHAMEPPPSIGCRGTSDGRG